MEGGSESREEIDNPKEIKASNAKKKKKPQLTVMATLTQDIEVDGLLGLYVYVCVC